MKFHLVVAVVLVVDCNGNGDGNGAVVSQLNRSLVIGVVLFTRRFFLLFKETLFS